MTDVAVVPEADGAGSRVVSPPVPICPFCCSSVNASTSKCPSCGEWIRWTRRRALTAGSALVVVLSLLFTAREIQESSRLQKVAAIQRLNDLYKDLDIYLVDHPELSAVIAPNDDYQFTMDALAHEGGRNQIRQINFAAYVLDLLEEERRLKAEFKVEEFSDEEFLIPILTNPNVAQWWEDPGLKHWYPKDFRDHVDGLLAQLRRGGSDE